MSEEKRINFEVSVPVLKELINQEEKTITSVMIQLKPGENPVIVLAGMEGMNICLKNLIPLRPINL